MYFKLGCCNREEPQIPEKMVYRFPIRDGDAFFVDLQHIARDKPASDKAYEGGINADAKTGDNLAFCALRMRGNALCHGCDRRSLWTGR